ncbi:nucleotidyltransferase domain-containing protein [Oceanobacillus sojae]|uniref:nucleotidyltransferase domain-containing protein n=1 Tax=Oceanobacillus sojae TaxID=582851 RepID=UPI00362E540A
MENRHQLDLRNIPEELQLMIELLRNNHLEEWETFTDINWETFIDLAIHHRIYPVLYPKLKKVKEGIVPPFVLERFSWLYRRNTMKMLFLGSEMQKISKLFSDNHIRLLFLKGPVLAQALYGDISLRTSRDLDVLIPIEKLDEAEHLLLAQGYEKEYEINKELNEWKWRHRHVNYYHPQKKITIEIHWRLNTGPAKEPNFNELWERRKQSTIPGNEVYMLSNEDLYLYLNMHGAQHGWSRLRWLFDIHQLMEKELNWNRIYNRLKRFGYLQVGGQGMILVSELFNRKLSNEMQQYLVNSRSKRLAAKSIFYLESMINIYTLPLPENVVKYHKKYLTGLMSTEQRILFTLSLLYPYPDDMKTLPLPKTLHFLYFPLRPFLWVWRKRKKHVLS